MAGYKVWAQGEELLADDLNFYLMAQSVPRFADADDRAAQMGTPVDGMVSYVIDPGTLEIFEDGEWVDLAGSGGGIASVNGDTGPDVVLDAADVGAAPTSHTHAGSDITSGTVPTARLSVGTTTGTVAAGDDSRVVGAAQKSANLSDLANATTARTNLGLGGAATLAVGTAAGTVAAGDDSRITGAVQKASNLSDLGSATTARTNLGLGDSATKNTGTSSGTVAAGDDSRIVGAVQKSTATTKGDVLVATAAGTITRLAAGTDGNVLTADSTTTEGLKWAAASGGSSTTPPLAVPVITGRYYSAPPLYNVAFNSPALNTMLSTPFPLSGSGTLKAIVINVNSVGTAGAVARLGIYSSTSATDFTPNTLIYDAGTVATTTTGNVELTLPTPQALTSGVYWIAYVAQVAASTANVASVNPGGSPFLAPYSMTVGWSQSAGYKSSTTVSGALPTLFSASTTTTSLNVPAFYLKF